MSLKRTGVAALVATMLLAGTTALASNAHVAAAKSKGTVTILATAPINDPYYSAPQWTDTSTVFADYFNAQGGFGGYKLKIDTCDNLLSPAGAVTCAQQAVSDHAVAEVGFALPNSSMLSTLAAANIAWVPGQAATAVETQSTDSFPVNQTALYTTAATSALAIKDKCPSAGLLVLASAAGQATVQAQQLTANGITNNTALAPATAVDQTPYIQQLAKDKCLILTGVSNTVLPGIASAITETGTHFAHIIGTGDITTAIVQSDPSVWGNVQIGLATSDESSPVWDTFHKAVAKYSNVGGFDNPKAPFSQPEGGWEAMVILGDVITHLASEKKAITAANVLGSLKSNHAWPVAGIESPVNFDKSLKIPGAPRIFNAQGFFSVVKNGKLVPGFGGKGVNLASIIANQKATGPFFN